ncbi:MAG: hypothetical protein QM791_13125 [Ferruginibacter sp.]
MKLITAVLLVSKSFTSCKKETIKAPDNKPTENAVLLEGNWVGKWGYTGTEPVNYFSINIKNDGTIEELSPAGEVVAIGSWILKDNLFTVTHHYLLPYSSVFTSTATFDPVKKTLTGKWKNTSTTGDSGGWYLHEN